MQAGAQGMDASATNETMAGGADREPQFHEFQYKKIGEIRFKVDTKIDETLLLSLVELTQNVDILTRSKIRKSIELLYATGDFTNVLVDAELAGERVNLTFILKSIYRIESIDIRGQTGIRPGKISKKLGLKKFEPYTPERILQGRDQILEILHQHGYFNAHVKQDVLLHRTRKRAALVYIVQSGNAARVQSVDIKGESFYSEEQILSKMKSRPGSTFKNGTFLRDLEKIEEHYDKNGFLEHSIEPQQKVLPPPVVEIEITINSGKQLVLTTEGYDFDPDVIREQVPIWVEHSYNDDTLEEGKRNLTEVLQSKGFYEAKITWSKDTEGEKIRIFYKIEPGIRYKVDEVRIAGNHELTDDEIREIMQTGQHGILGSARLVERIFDEDRKRILSAYHLRGFLFARFTRDDVLRMRGGKIAIDLEIDEGPQSIVSEIRIKGNQALQTEELLRRFQQKEGESVSETRVKADSDFIVALYSDMGYPQMQLENRLLLSQDKKRAIIEYRIDEGEQIFVDRIVISGAYRTKRDAIEESIYLEEDDPLSLRKISESQSRLYGLNIFDRVEMVLPRPDSLQKFQSVLIRLTESRPYTITYGAGYQSFDRFRGIFGISNRNLFGTGRTLAFNSRAGFREGRALVSYIDPYLFPRFFNSDVSVFAEYGEREGFSFNRYGASLQVEKRLSRESVYAPIGSQPEPSKSFFLRYAFEDVDTFGVESTDPEDRPFLAIHISSVTAGLVRDNRDNAIDPQTGTFFSSSSQTAASLIGSETDFVKSFTQAQYYRPFRKTVIATSFRLGLAWGFRETDRLPISQRFFAGGGRTIRGFEQDKAGPLDENGEPEGGNTLTIMNLEYRFPVFGSLGAVVFLDYGTVFRLISDVSISEMREAAGIGIRYKTPIGPLTVDWGYKLDRRQGESPSEFFISVGHAF